MSVWVRRIGTIGRTAPQTSRTQAADELEVELALLREENARLKVKRERKRDRPVNERVRELLPRQQEDGDALELLADCWLLRDDLIDACREIERSMRDTRERLEAIDVATSDAERARDELERVA